MDGMRWIISHQSALEYWRKTDAKGVLAGKRLRAMKPQARLFGTAELRADKFWGFAVPLHVLVGSGNARKVNRYMHSHVSPGEFPDGSFVRMDSGLVISSPELCFLQMAGEIPFANLVALGFELCGTYRLDRESADGKGFRGDLPLTSAYSLGSYASRAVGLKGRKNAMKALSFIADGSASPMETILAILLVLPYRLGGYGFPMPLFNHRIDMPASVVKADGKSKYYYCDFYWPDKKVAVEYDSDAFHTGSERIAEDAIRRNALSRMGITVVTAARMLVFNSLKMHEFAEVLSKLLGKRLQYSQKEFKYRHAKLLRQLFTKLPADR